MRWVLCLGIYQVFCNCRIEMTNKKTSRFIGLEVLVVWIPKASEISRHHSRARPEVKTSVTGKKGSGRGSGKRRFHGPKYPRQAMDFQVRRAKYFLDIS